MSEFTDWIGGVFNELATGKPRPGKLADAVQNRDAAAVKALLARGADPNERGRYSDSTVLMMTASYGELAIAKMLLEAGADINARTARGGVLHSAVIGKHPEMVRFLLDRHAP